MMRSWRRIGLRAFRRLPVLRLVLGFLVRGGAGWPCGRQGAVTGSGLVTPLSAEGRRWGDRVMHSCSRCPGLLTWSEIWCDVENSKSFRSSYDRRVSQGHRLRGASALHNYLALIFHCSGRDDTEQYAGKHQKEPGHEPRDTPSPGDYVRNPGARLREGAA
jgi:hypothetical protein